MKPKLNMNRSDLLQKEFSRTLNGYRPEEVDEYFDKVIDDYEQYDAKIAALEKTIFELKAELEQKKTELNGVNTMYRELKSKVPSDSQLINLQKAGEISNLAENVKQLLEQIKDKSGLPPKKFE